MREGKENNGRREGGDVHKELFDDLYILNIGNQDEVLELV